MSRDTMPWERFSTEHTASVVAIELRSADGVRARVELRRQGDVPVTAYATFGGADARLAWRACLRATADVFVRMADRAASGACPFDLQNLVMNPLSPAYVVDGFDGGRLELTGADAWVMLVAVFGDAYAEVMP
jgi:hypothetical protein